MNENNRALRGAKVPVSLKGVTSVWIVTMLVSVSLTPILSATDRRDLINAARCRVRCLGNLHEEEDRGLAAILNRVKQSRSLARCLESTECTACMTPCSQPFTNLELCQSVCEENTLSCLQSCEYLEEISQTHAGSCPQLSSSDSCTTPCNLDTECGRQEKCCTRECGKTCLSSIDRYHGMPAIPQAPTIRERVRGGSLELRWESVHTNETGLILYIVDSKWNVGMQPSEAQATQWQQIAQATEQTTNMRDVTPGHWYQFRVEAVNVYGSRGPSAPTQPFGLSGEPTEPGPPANLTEGDTLITDDRVAVTIKWLPPVKSDLPINRYRVFWSKRLGSPQEGIDTDSEQRHVLPGDQLVFQIPGLEQDTTYFVQVQAVCHYGDRRLKSEKASMFITTYPTFPRAERVSRPREVNIVPLPTPSAVIEIEITQPYYHLGQMKANVSWNLPAVHDGEPHIAKVLLFWSPEVCIANEDEGHNLSRPLTGTTHDTKFIIYRLRFDCRYIVKVQSMSAAGVTGPVAQLSFPTPSCNEVVLVTDQRPDCPQSMRAPEQPPGLQHKFIIISSVINASVTWGIPVSDTPITGYRVLWGKAQDAYEPELNRDTARTQVLPKEQRSFSTGSLEEASTYVVEVCGLTEEMTGRVAKIHFTTPMLSVPHLDSGYKQVSSGTHQSSSLGTVSTTTKIPPTPQPVGHTPDLSDQLPDSSSTRNTPYLFTFYIFAVALATHLLCHH